MKVAILDDYQNAVTQLSCFDLLKYHEVTVFNDTIKDPERLAERLQPFDALVLIRERTEITEALLSRLPNLKLISQTGKISNHIDPALCHRFGVEIAEGKGSPVAPSELGWALIMAASRHIPSYSSQLARGQWQQSSMGLGRTLHGQTLGIWGYGKIGQRIAQFAKLFDMQVMVWGSENSRQKAVKDGFLSANSKQEFFQTVDILSLHLRLNEVTRGFVRQEDLAEMKADSLFVNISRAELVEQNALYEELVRVPTKQAALDVFENEPATPENEPLLTLPNVVATPHLGYVEQNSYELYFQIAFENVVAFASGQPKNLVPKDSELTE
ncbi:D-2-hydroxyacid dehydrogenase family protein [Vibrio sp. SCSIO 43132]|uniref:D-2-hydroxyacid dehydrogenase family protein n=1 Tax=Vibrio sp. SCSIO 43132 TaxID=2779363 RepID=UPI001CA87ADD|nr:D-2-hydroxyacid dehydrogenase family protein [Vibrio sp. SCSIO 43132]UAB73088.1 D-2-hydroxyacid dehydrogenase family protein [Vibrio sp. SCSIO 43132]